MTLLRKPVVAEPDPSPMSITEDMSQPIVLPRVLVIVTCHNYARFVERALESVAAQTYPNFACIVVDDHSTDGSAQVIAAWRRDRSDPRFQLIHTSDTVGQLGAIATALAHGTGEFVAMLDADDVWLPAHLETHVRAHLNTFAAVGVTCSDMVLVDAEDRVLSGTFRGEGTASVPARPGAFAVSADKFPVLARTGANTDAATFPPAIVVKPDLFRWHWTATSAMVFRRSMLDLVMPAQPLPDRLGADHYLIQLCHFFTGSMLIDARLGAYRRHGNNGFASFAVYGATAAQAPYATFDYLDTNLFAMATHVLDRRETFENLFGAHRVRALILAVVGHRLRVHGRVGDRRMTRLLGYRALPRALLREFQRRRHS